MRYAISALMLTGLLMGACNKKEEAKTKVPEPAKAEAAPSKPEFATPDSFKVGLGKVYGGYLQIGTALAHDDFQKAKDAFQSMHAVLHILPIEGMDMAASANWDSLDGRLMKVLHPMSASPDISTMRTHFADFTPLMLEAIENFGLVGPDPVYLYHCPMARNNEGADWLQGDKKLLNPFYGGTMPKCGNLVEAVKL